MSAIDYRVLESFPEPAFTVLAHEAFSDHAPSTQLTDMLAQEVAARKWQPASQARSLRIGAFLDDVLVGWTCAREHGSMLQMINSGVAAAVRRQGIYSRMVQRVLDHAKSQGHASVQSRHASSNNAVIIAKLRLGFFVSGFEYSEVYGPLVRLTYLPGELRRKLHQARAVPIRRHDAG